MKKTSTMPPHWMSRNQYQILAKLVCMSFWNDDREERFYSDHPRQTKFPQLTPCPIDTDWYRTPWSRAFRLGDVLEGLICQPLRNNMAIKSLKKWGLIKEFVVDIKVGNLTMPRPYVMMTDKTYDWADARWELPGHGEQCEETGFWIPDGMHPKCLDLTKVKKHAQAWKRFDALVKEKRRLKAAGIDYRQLEAGPSLFDQMLYREFPYNPRP
jgi:predicted DCC family thiol-disulfide oxidoreductase YuxK